MKIGIPKESLEGEKRVATTPDVVKQLIKLGYEINIESQAGEASNFSDEDYIAAGASISGVDSSIWEESDILIKVRPPSNNEVEKMREGQVLIGFIWPAQNASLIAALSRKKVNVLAMDSVPRISRAQKMDALSSMANIAGYRAVIEAAEHFGRFFTGQITAAGKVPPAKVMVIGAGVAGLSAIGTAKGLGAIVRAFDTRPEVKEQIQSMDAEFLELDFEEEGSGEGGYAKTMSDAFIAAEMALFADQAKEVDIIITTALIPGKQAPELITADMVKSMKTGSVIVDLAAEQGGNCELTQAGKVVKKHGVTIVGYTDLPSRLPTQASQLYATNIRHLLTDLTPEKDGQIVIDMEDEAIRGATVVKDGSITWPPPPPTISVAKKPESVAPEPVQEVEEKKKSILPGVLSVLTVSILMLWLGAYAPESFMAHFTVFVLACFVGYMVIWNVTPALHTPLMSVTNAISSIIIIGALVQISSGSFVTILAAITVFLTGINIFGGFGVTHRMLEMFKK